VSLRGAGGRFVSEARAGFSARLREAFEAVTASALGLWMESSLRGGLGFRAGLAPIRWRFSVR